MENIESYCLDSDILIDYLRGVDSARHFLLEASMNARLFMSVISIAELYSGKETLNLNKKEAMEKFLCNFSVVNLDARIAVLAGELRRDHGRPFADMLLAATAISHNLILITKNLKHFRGLTKLNYKEPY